MLVLWQKYKEMLKWNSIYNISEALKETTEWYKRYYNENNSEELYKFTIEQIKEYMKRGGYYAGN